MFKCEVCGRKFKSKQAFGGHMSTAHPTNPCESAEATVDNTDIVESAEVEEDEAPGVGEQIRGYLTRGYDFAQLEKKFGFDPRSIRREAEKVIKPASEQEEERGAYLPDTYKSTEVMNPEAIMRRYTDGSYEDELELRGMMKLRGAMLMVLDLAAIQERFASAEAKRLDPLLKVLREGREELDAAAARASGQSYAMAHEAAEEAVARIAAHIDQKLPKPPPPKDTEDVVTRMLGKMTDMMMGQFESQMNPQSMGTKGPEGWEYQGPPSQPQPGPLQPMSPQTQGGMLGWSHAEGQAEEKEDDDNG